MSAVDQLAALGAVEKKPDLLLPAPSLWTDMKDAVGTALGGEKSSVLSETFDAFEQRLDREWVARTKIINWELEAQARGAMVWALAQNLARQPDHFGAIPY